MAVTPPMSGIEASRAMPFKGDPIRTQTVQLTSFPLPPHSPYSCPMCSESLDIHQPDLEDPENLLAICDGCHAWYVVNVPQHIMTLFPK